MSLWQPFVTGRIAKTSKFVYMSAGPAIAREFPEKWLVAERRLQPAWQHAEIAFISLPRNTEASSFGPTAGAFCNDFMRFTFPLLLGSSAVIVLLGIILALNWHDIAGDSPEPAGDKLVSARPVEPEKKKAYVPMASAKAADEEPLVAPL